MGVITLILGENCVRNCSGYRPVAKACAVWPA